MLSSESVWCECAGRKFFVMISDCLTASFVVVVVVVVVVCFFVCEWVGVGG